MKGKILFLVTLFLGVGIANAAVRDEKTIIRNTATTTNIQSTARNTSGNNVISRTATKNSAVRNTVSSRSGIKSTTPTKHTNARSAKTNIARTAAPIRNASKRPSSTSVKNTLSNVRSAKTIVSRASSAPVDPATQMGTGYIQCRDAYFTCMDQFCGVADDTYRRCYCSNRLSEIQSRERALTQAATQIEDFKALNLEVIDKTTQEVQSMVSATVGEQAQENARDKSDSAKQLSGISDVLSKTKKQSLSTQGTLDIAGDIDAIWSTTELTGGANLTNLSGEPLYNAVHAQCSEMVASSCPDAATKTMAVTAYGMYIENDCSLLINALDKKLVAANAVIRDTEYAMGDLRLENYNAHNATAINECIAQVRQDITANTACGTDYVHCLDVTGRYLNYETGEPIYTAEFFQLDTQSSLSGDVLTNQTNRLLVDRLNGMRAYAKRGLDTCRDIADNVWQEFLRQAITEIHQGQQDRIRQVKNECLDVVTKCYDEQNKSLKDFSNTDEALLLGSRLELSEAMCQEKMDTCSNLYGGGTVGLQELVNAMYDIIEQQIAQQCLTTLQDYTKELCAVPGTDTLHAYPYGCRVYTPGSQEYASNTACNKIERKAYQVIIYKNTKYRASCTKEYTSCNEGFYWENKNCIKCPKDTYCPAGTQGKPTTNNACPADYINSLYYKLVTYATDSCIRPSKRDETLPYTVLQDINVVMDQIRSSLSKELAKECERLGGTWVSNAYDEDQTNDKLLPEFQKETAANTDWGYCKK